MAETLQDKEQRLFFTTYKRLPLDIVRGEGMYLFDRQGKRYIDFFGGLAVNALGYGHPRVLEAIARQAGQYIHLSNFFLQEPQVRLAEKLLQVTGFRRVFFSNSGTEAIEGAIKLARKWAKGSNRTTIFGMSNAFHGRTFGALSLMDKPKYRDDYGPFLPSIESLEFNDVASLRSKVGRDTIAVVLEFIQGEGGIFTVSPAFVKELNALREQYGFLIIGDCIQCGIGRTGRFFSYEHVGCTPDVVVFAKAVGGGLPLGGFLGNDRVEHAFTYGVHGTTFGGNPVACAAGLAVVEEVVNGGLMRHAAEMGEYLRSAAERLRTEFPGIIQEVRGFGCMLGIDLARPGQAVVDELQKRGVLVNCTHETVLRLLPPLILQREHCDILTKELRDILSGMAP